MTFEGPITRLSVLLAVLVTSIGAARAVEVGGYVGAEVRGFLNTPLDPGQERHNASLVAEPEFYWRLDDDQSVLFVPFVRVDSADARRTHWDVRELIWERIGDPWELRVGLGHVFWGVTESQHLVDIINQTDAVENIDGEDKLGQPMVNLGIYSHWGNWEFFVLPGFRPRTFPGTAGRLRTIPVVADTELYESGARERHVDFALRWSQVLGDWDIGLSHFYGTSREPELIPALSPSGNQLLVPRYSLIHQTGLDLQATLGAMLWKFEAIYRTGQGDGFLAATGGFEYTFNGVMETAVDLGVLLEYHFDSRGRNGGGFQDDIFAGMRLAFNDVQSSELLAGAITDRESGATTFSVEASRRLGDAWTVEVEARVFTNIDARDPMFSLRKDDYLQVALSRYF